MPKTFRWARRVALATYRKALKAAEKGDWKEADRLTNSRDCAFCVARKEQARKRPGIFTCKDAGCPVISLCHRTPDMVAWFVAGKEKSRSWGLRRLRSTIAQLEKLEIGA